MTFTGLPGWAVGALLVGFAGALGVLHLLRIRPRAVRVVTTMFWADDLEQPQARSLLQRFRHPGTFALLLLLVALLCLALGDPRRAVSPAERVWEVVVLDAGASMAAPDESTGTTRIDSARAAVETEIARLSQDDRLAIVVAGPQPQVVYTFDDPRAVAVRRLREVTPAGLPAARMEAMRVARALLRGRTNPRLVVVTDRSRAPAFTVGIPAVNGGALDAGEGGEGGEGGEAVDVQYRVVGAPADNAAILSAMFEPSADQPVQGRLAARVGYWGGSPRSIAVTVRRAGGAVLLRETETLDPGTIRDFVTADLPADGDLVYVELATRDAVAADNRVALRLPLRGTIPMWMGDGLPEALRVALASNPFVRTADSPDLATIEVGVGGSLAGDKAGLVVASTGPDGPAGQSVTIVPGSPLVAGLDFEGAICGTGAALDLGDRPSLVPLVGANGSVLAAMGPADEKPRRAYLSTALLAADGTVANRAAFAILLGRMAADLAGWRAGPLVLAPERALADPVWITRQGEGRDLAVMPGSREASNLVGSPEAAATSGPVVGARWALPAPFETLIILALAVLLLDGVLHTRGRIP